MRLAIDTQRLVELASDLIAIDSQNPPGDETAVAKYCVDLLKTLELSVQIVGPPGRPSVLATPYQSVDGPTLLFNGHLDVVPVKPEAWRFPPFSPTVEGDRLFGRGSSDMKGGIAAALEAYRCLLASGWKRDTNVVFHLVADEELGGALGTKWLVEHDLVKADACIDPEPTDLRIGIAERGLIHAQLDVTGVPAHASTPSAGVSAIERAAAITLALQGTTFAENHPLLGSPSANVGTIEGGTAPNVVAEFCRMKIDRRLLPGMTVEQALESIRAKIDQLGLDDLDYQLQVLMYGEGSEISRQHPFVDFVADQYKLIDVDPVFVGMQFTTDARFVRNDCAIPTLVLGPGELAQAHTVDESVSIDSLGTAATLYAGIISKFSGFVSSGANEPLHSHI